MYLVTSHHCFFHPLQVRRWEADVSVRAASHREPARQEPKAPFYFCRRLLNDLGMNSWDRR